MYCLRDVSPVSVKVVAVAATAATCAKIVQPVPWHRSIWTWVWLAEVFVQLSRIELRDNAVAVKAVGAVGGGGAVTTITMDVLFDRPPLAVTDKVAVYVPGVV